MTAKKIILATAILLSASSAALAQSAYTTGTAESSAAAGFQSPYRGGFYAYAPDTYAPGSISRPSSGYSSFAMVPQVQGQSIDNPALNGGGSGGYNELLRRDW
jgi:hypothetical protein